MRSSTRTLINALRVLDSEIQSKDGVANAVVAEAATRLEEQWERIKRLEEALSEIAYAASHPLGAGQSLMLGKIEAIALKAKEAKP